MYPSSQEGPVGGSLQVWKQPGLYSKTLSWKQNSIPVTRPTKQKGQGSRSTDPLAALSGDLTAIYWHITAMHRWPSQKAAFFRAPNLSCQFLFVLNCYTKYFVAFKIQYFYLFFEILMQYILVIATPLTSPPILALCPFGFLFVCLFLFCFAFYQTIQVQFAVPIYSYVWDLPW